MGSNQTNSDLNGVRAKQAIAGKALRFVYPGLKFTDNQILPYTAVVAMYLARALDSTSRITYGAFKFYESVSTGVLTGKLVWSDIPKSVFEALDEALEDEQPQRNVIASAFIRQACPERLLQLHLEKPDVYPTPELRLSPGTPLHKLIFEKKGVL